MDPVILEVFDGIIEYESCNGSDVLASKFTIMKEAYAKLAQMETVPPREVGQRIADAYLEYDIEKKRG